MSGLYSGSPGLSLGTGLYRAVSGLWSGASGLIAGFGGEVTPENAVRDRQEELVKTRAGENVFTRLAVLAGVSSLAAIGSMTAGSEALALSSNPGFQVGNYVIVETGGEAGAGLRGSRGVGGSWPSLSYATVSAMNADTAQAVNRAAWVEATGDVYYWNGSAWVQPDPVQYYVRKAVPKALVAQVVGVSGNTLTLDKPAAVSTTSANVYFDNWSVIQGLLSLADQVDLPAGTYAVSDYIYVGDRAGKTIAGAGKTATILKTPNGASHGGCFVLRSPDFEIRDLSFDCNFRELQYSFRWEDGRAAASGRVLTEFFTDIATGYGKGVFFQQSNNSVARNVRVINPAQQAVATAFSYDCYAYNCTARIDEPLKQYIQWMFQWTDIPVSGRGGGCVDCDVDSEHLGPGFEAFGARDVTFLRCSTRNAVNANNGSVGTLFDELSVVIEEGCAQQSYVSSLTPILDFNANAFGSAEGAQCVVRNPTIIQEGYVRNSTDRLRAITVNGGSAPVLVEGTYDTDPVTPKGLIECIPAPVVGTNQYFGGAVHGGTGSTGSVTVQGIRAKVTMLDVFVGPMHTDQIPITVTDSIFDPDTVTGPGGSITQSGNQTNAEYEA